MKFFLSFIFFSQVCLLSAQEVEIRNIHIEGLKKTKESVVLRELSFKVGKKVTLDEVPLILAESKQNLQNQWLFNFIEFTPTLEDQQLDIKLKVIERWYVWPYPIFEISERNFNVFWDSLYNSQFTDFSNLNYGVFLNWYNFRGRNELLKIKYRIGFKEHYQLEYEVPFLNRAKTWGASLNLELFQMKKFQYKTDRHELVYTKLGENQMKDQKFSLSIQYKPKLHNTHKFSVEKTQMSTLQPIDNPLFFLNQDKHFNYLKLDYYFTREKRDYIIYPLEGNMSEVWIEYYNGLKNDYENISLTTKLEYHYNIYPRWFIGSSLKTKKYWKNNLPYILNQSFGYDDYLRGYEYYVIDGSAFALSKTALKWTLLPKTDFQLPFIPMESISKTHFSIYLSIFADVGYVRNFDETNNPLNNRLLMSQGFSMDVVSYYDKLIRLECSRNHMGETGFYLHFSNPF